jgi:hypothetical protein
MLNMRKGRQAEISNVAACVTGVILQDRWFSMRCQVSQATGLVPIWLYRGEAGRHNRATVWLTQSAGYCIIIIPQEDDKSLEAESSQATLSEQGGTLA